MTERVHLLRYIVSFVEMMKLLFVHDMDMFSQGEILESHIGETELNDNLRKLIHGGVLVKEFLEAFAAMCDVNPELLATLLNHLKIAYTTPGLAWTFFPYYLRQFQPENFDSDKYTKLTLDKLLIVIRLHGYLPCVYLNKLIIGLYPYLYPERTDVERHIWDKHFCFDFNYMTVYLEQVNVADQDRISLYLNAALDVYAAHEMWNLVRHLTEVMETIKDTFPGLVLDCFQECPHCGICKWNIRRNINQTCSHPSELSRCKENQDTSMKTVSSLIPLFKETNHTSCRWPSSLFYPLTKGNCL
jgi:hypothetical protein